MIRKPAVAGKFYPEDHEVLCNDVTRYIASAHDKYQAKAIMVPHAGYIYSGAVAGEVFGSVASIPSTVILLGPNHTGLGCPFSLRDQGVWQMPMGEVDVDHDLCREFLKKSELLASDVDAHRFEHGLEVEIPFLQNLRSDVKIIPIVMGSQETSSLITLGQQIADVIQGQDVLIVVSSDMTHFESQTQAFRKDHLAIQALASLDAAELERVVKGECISMCGYGPAYAMLVAGRELGLHEGRLIRYQTSGDVSGDHESVVGYAGMVFS